MSKYVIMNQVKEGQGGYNEETGEYEHDVQSFPTVVNLDAVRCFYPRKGDRPGTRLTFTDGGGFAVSEAFDQILTAVAAYQGMAVPAVAGPASAALESTH